MRCKIRDIFSIGKTFTLFFAEKDERKGERGPQGKSNGERPFDFWAALHIIFKNVKSDYQRFGLMLLHSEIAGTMFNVTSSSRILQR